MTRHYGDAHNIFLISKGYHRIYTMKGPRGTVCGTVFRKYYANPDVLGSAYDHTIPRGWGKVRGENGHRKGYHFIDSHFWALVVPCFQGKKHLIRMQFDDGLKIVALVGTE